MWLTDQRQTAKNITDYLQNEIKITRLPTGKKNQPKTGMVQHCKDICIQS